MVFLTPCRSAEVNALALKQTFHTCPSLARDPASGRHDRQLQSGPLLGPLKAAAMPIFSVLLPDQSHWGWKREKTVDK